MTLLVHEANEAQSAAQLFDACADAYDQIVNTALAASGETKEYFAAGRVMCLASLLAQYGVKAESVLDYGCGTGGSTRLFFDILKCRAAVCVDVSRASIEIGERNHRRLPARFQLVAEHEPRGDIDVAYCNGVFHHIAPNERPAALSHVFRSLREGGLFAFFENNPWNPGTRHCMRVNPLDRDAHSISPIEARGLLHAAGFAIVATRYLFFFPRALRALRLFEPFLSRMPLGGQYLVLARKERQGRAPYHTRTVSKIRRRYESSLADTSGCQRHGQG